eukprot:TRINITY_DN11106_c0_g2_i1.p1 TRINITY_DN11106_c0_g2~~TRINITY_DN11106_c0_g2_i1.p1  ORF type:complete len:294 (+),score=54.28 TRINITY_DN11106_c0_g2_i1:169-1050(+)
MSAPGNASNLQGQPRTIAGQGNFVPTPVRGGAYATGANQPVRSIGNTPLQSAAPVRVISGQQPPSQYYGTQGQGIQGQGIQGQGIQSQRIQYAGAQPSGLQSQQFPPPANQYATAGYPQSGALGGYGQGGVIGGNPAGFQTAGGFQQGPQLGSYRSPSTGTLTGNWQQLPPARLGGLPAGLGGFPASPYRGYGQVYQFPPNDPTVGQNLTTGLGAVDGYSGNVIKGPQQYIPYGSPSRVGRPFSPAYYGPRVPFGGAPGSPSRFGSQPPSDPYGRVNEDKSAKPAGENKFSLC